MTPKEKADELVTKFRRYLPMNLTTMLDAKNCAIIAVDEIINSVIITDLTVAENQFIYWEEVKQEIEEL